jgi:hypothetical protein
MQRPRNRRTGRALCGLALLALAAGASGSLAGDREDWLLRDKVPRFPQPTGERALVVVLRPQPGEYKNDWLRLHLDDRPLGFLPGGSYLTALVEPGTRLVWTRTKSQWLTLKVGRTYVLRIESGHSIEFRPFDDPGLPSTPTSTNYESWYPESPDTVRELVYASRLVHVRTTEGGFAALRKGLPKRFKKALKWSPPRPQSSLPVSFDSIRYRDEDPSWMQTNTNLEVKTPRGRLRVEPQRIRYESGKTRFDIPVSAIRDVEPPRSTPNRRSWVVVRYTVGETAREAYFQSARDENARIYLAIVDALAPPDAD